MPFNDAHEYPKYRHWFPNKSVDAYWGPGGLISEATTGHVGWITHHPTTAATREIVLRNTAGTTTFWRTRALANTSSFIPSLEFHDGMNVAFSGGANNNIGFIHPHHENGIP